jgi:mannose-6-phosphate isomerase-like protein (cupin superfamily)
MNAALASALTFACALPLGAALAQSPDRFLPRGQPTVVSAADVAAVVATLGAQRNIDKLVRTVDSRGPAGHISIAAVAYHAGPQEWDGTANEHHDITEVFHVTRGSATFVMGGDLEGAKEFDSRSEPVRRVFGPGRGGKVSGQRRITARIGDNIVLPPHTPHQIVEVTEEFEMVVIRIDPGRVLQID